MIAHAFDASGVCSGCDRCDDPSCCNDLPPECDMRVWCSVKHHMGQPQHPEQAHLQAGDCWCQPTVEPYLR